MRNALRTIAWIVLVGGPVSAVLSSLPLLSSLVSTQSSLPTWQVLLNLTVQVVLGAASPIAIGGGLLVILDMDKRVRHAPAEEV